MPQADNAVFQSYLDHVQSQIKWKRARKPLLKELSDHILDQKREYEAEGQAPDEALSRAVSEMGDPVSVGRELDRLHKPENHWVPAIVFLLTAFVGSLIIGPAVGSGYAIYRQLFAVLCSAILLPAVWFSDYTVLYRRTGWCFLAGGGGVVLSYLFLRMGADPLVTVAGWRRIFIYLALLMPILYTAVLCRFRPKGTVGALGFGTLAVVFSLTAMG